MLVCGCGRWMHTEGVEERIDDAGDMMCFIRSECRACAWRVGVDVPLTQGPALVDHLMWTDEGLHALDRLPPYVRVLVRSQVEDYVRAKGGQLITFDQQLEARRGESVTWDAEAQARLDNVPAGIRAMAKMELERTAVESGVPRVTVRLMEQVKARYFGMGARAEKGGA